MGENLEELLSAPIEAIFEKMGTNNETGLSSGEVAKRFERFGPNQIIVQKKRTVLTILLTHFWNPVILILLIAGVLAAFISNDHGATTIIIISIIALNIALDYFQEARAFYAADSLQQKVAVTVTVLRDGSKKEIHIEKIVLGDIIFFHAGDFVPADTRLITAKDFFVDQAELTGESLPVEKVSTKLNENQLAIMDWSNCAFMGSSIVSGFATGVVIRVGYDTEFAKIATHLMSKENYTEFEKGSRRFGNLLIEVTLLVVLIVFFVLSFTFIERKADFSLWNQQLLSYFLFALALGVGLAPNLLTTITSLNLSRAAMSMAKKGVIVKQLRAIQNLGNMDVLCIDKTGTITENTIQLVRRVDIDGNDDEKVYFYSYLNSYFHSGLKTSNDDAVLAISGINVEDYEKIDEIPYDFTRRRITIVVRRANEQFLIAKGDPDDILRTCITCEEGTCAYDMDEESVEKIRNKYEDLSSEGFRVLSIAYKSVPIENRQYSVNDETDLIFLGFIAFIDPPREDATEAFQKLYRAGVKVKILTGDNEIFTQRIMEQLNIPVEGVLVGQDMIYDTDEALARMVEKTNVFARVTPGQKSRILNTLKSNGHVVGFLGDGINDASTITNADVGISSSNAVSIAKQSADIILDPKNLSNLCDGIIIARRTFSNTLKYMLLATSSRYGNMVSLALIAVFLPFVPLLPRQILLTNLLSDITYSAIPTDNVDDNVLTKPRKLDISYIRKFMLIIGPVSSLMDILTFLIVAFLIIGGDPSDFTLDQIQIVQTCLFLEFLITEIVEVFALRTPSSPFSKNKPSRSLVLTCAIIIGITILLPYTQFGSDIFQFGAIPPSFYALLVVINIIFLIAVYYMRRWFYSKNAYRLEQSYIPLDKTILGQIR